ncbi:MAG: class I SAM-dependent methyltransferase [Candidatus Woesearchaeota archaeon]
MKRERENIKCNICNSGSYSTYTMNSGFKIVKCNKCGLIYVNPQPTMKYLVDFYSTGIYDEESWDIKRRYTDFLNESHRKVAETILKQYKDRKVRVLDIGCGLKQFEYIKKNKGYVIGTEISKTFIKSARKKGWNVVFGDVLDMKWNGKFDAIVMLDVIEHLKNPTKYLLKCKELLKDDGILIVQTPNLNYTLKKSTTLPVLQSMHLYYFTPKTLIRLFDKCGYEVLSIKPELNLGSDNLIKNIIMRIWDKIARIIYAVTGIHTNLQLVVYVKKK